MNSKSSSSIINTKQSVKSNSNGMNFNISNQDLNNVDENSFDLDMDSAEDEIDVGTHADSMLINYQRNTNNLHNHNHLEQQNYHPSFSNTNTNNSLILPNNNQFNSASILNHQGVINQDTNFALPQPHTTSMSEADRKRAHHNALERKRRDHIKDSFHTLRDAIPNIKGEKVSTSRAQILKAATDYIKTMKNRNTVYQNDIDLIKKQNMEIETQIRLLETSKTNGNNQCLNSGVIIKTEQMHPLTPTYMQMNDTSDENDFKFDLNESMQTSNNSNVSNSVNMLPHVGVGHHHHNKPNNVLILSKPNGGQVQTATTAKKFKTIVTPKTSLMNNSGNYLV